MTTHRESLHDRILDVAMSLFLEHGIRAVRMDDIANHLSISKRTLYEVFSNKEQLLMEGIARSHEAKRKKARKLLEDSSNVMDAFIKLSRIELEDLKMLKPVFVSDLFKYPAVTDYFEQFRNEAISQAKLFLKQGVDEGYFRNDINYDLMIALLSEQRKYLLSSQLYREYSFEVTFFHVSILPIRGFCTDKGLEQLDSFISEELIKEINANG